MSAPRFKKGQIVVVYAAFTHQEENGKVGQVVGVDWKTLALNFSCWFYELENSECIFSESTLRPYDPPADWNDEDMVWKPESLTEKKPEEA